jgi:hypothetical protein
MVCTSGSALVFRREEGEVEPNTTKCHKRISFRSKSSACRGTSICLKGRGHKIFDFRFFHVSSSPELLIISLVNHRSQ